MLKKPYSLCELGTDNIDYSWLLYWLKTLEPSKVDMYLHYPGYIKIDEIYCSHREAFGLVFLFAVSEIARREASEGRVWPIVMEKVSKQARHLLFPANYPSQSLKEAIEEGARKFELRHLFGVEGVQNWYDCIFLQFGFTRKGIKRLPYWLYEYNMPVAIEYLLNSDLKSDSFYRLFKILKDYRNKNVSEKDTRRHLYISPWIFNDWIDEILEEAGRHIPGLKYNDGSNEEEVGGIPFLSEPRILWDFKNAPCFKAEFVNFSLLELEDNYYDLLNENGLLERVLIQDNSPEPGEIQIKGFPSMYHMQLSDRNGSIIEDMQVEFWSPNDEVNAFEYKTGRRIDPWTERMSTNKDYILLLSGDLEIEPSPEILYKFSNQKIKVCYLEKNWSADTVVKIDNDELWRPELLKNREKREIHKGFENLNVSPCCTGCLYPNEKFSIKVTGINGGWELRHLRMNGSSLGFKRFNSHYVSEELKFDESFLLCSGNISLILHNAEYGSTRISHPLEFNNFSGAILFSEDRPEFLSERKELRVLEAGNSLCRLFLPKTEVENTTIKDWCIMEGNSFSRRLSRRIRPLGNFAGYGAPLYLCIGPYNPLDSTILLNNKVINTGIIKSIRINKLEEVAEWTVELDRPLELDMDYSILLWNMDGLYDITYEKNQIGRFVAEILI